MIFLISPVETVDSALHLVGPLLYPKRKKATPLLADRLLTLIPTFLQ